MVKKLPVPVLESDKKVFQGPIKPGTKIKKFRKKGITEDIPPKKKPLKLKKGVGKRVGKKYEKWSKQERVSKKVLRKQPRSTLDLRQRQVEPVKQHGFKEMEIENTNFLFN